VARKKERKRRAAEKDMGLGDYRRFEKLRWILFPEQKGSVSLSFLWDCLACNCGHEDSQRCSDCRSKVESVVFVDRNQ
jgi:hypothetical protein